MKLNNNTVLITGGGSGIGLALAKAYVEQGSNVIICGRNKEKLRSVKKEFPKINTVTCDITNDDNILHLVAHIKNEYPETNILINNAGIQYNYDFTDKQNHTKLIEEEIDTNLLAQIKLIDSFIPLFQNRLDAAIINVSSSLAFVPKQSAPVYCATKAAIHIFTKSLRYQLENTIKVFEIIPPLVDTDMTKGRGKGKISTEVLAQEALKSIQRDNYEIKIGKSKALLFLQRFLPFVADKIVRNG